MRPGVSEEKALWLWGEAGVGVGGTLSPCPARLLPPPCPLHPASLWVALVSVRAEGHVREPGSVRPTAAPAWKPVPGSAGGNWGGAVPAGGAGLAHSWAPPLCVSGGGVGNALVTCGCGHRGPDSWAQAGRLLGWPQGAPWFPAYGKSAGQLVTEDSHGWGHFPSATRGLPVLV